MTDDHNQDLTKLKQQLEDARALVGPAGDFLRKEDWYAGKKAEIAAKVYDDAFKQGIKHDQDKPRMDLIDADFLEGLAQVLTFGSKKYAAHNWRGGIHVSRLVASSYRHLGAINRGEDTDSESGLPHVYHLACCVMFLSSMLATRPDLDDRYTKIKKETNNG